MSRDAQPPCVSSLNEKMFGHDYPCLKSAYNGALLFENKAPVLMASQSITFIRAASSAQRRRHARTRVPPSQTADAAARGVRLEGGAVHPLTLL
ncbi:hypothetical protein DPX16_3064 [Anabarilius grahami]|uniref:Uncharacterized protein n=1 Tax=Anabarilius grahami TaxID=495550 RepID=A0A3N0XJ07_ANAGA|nr:hypothetical protein DPX16_3064 [Anabarilius grahami]